MWGDLKKGFCLWKVRHPSDKGYFINYEWSYIQGGIWYENNKHARVREWIDTEIYLKESLFYHEGISDYKEGEGQGIRRKNPILSLKVTKNIIERGLSAEYIFNMEETELFHKSTTKRVIYVQRFKDVC